MFSALEKILDKNLKKYLTKQYEFYSSNLSNFSTVLKDTNNAVLENEDGDYNCMSYALGLFDCWADLDAFYLISDSYEFEEACKEDQEAMLSEMFLSCCIELEDRYNCKRISSPTANSPGTRVIAFRVGYDDFHFARLNSDGVWTHKPGASYIREMTEEELYDYVLCYHRFWPYESEVAFFEVAIQLTYYKNYCIIII